MYKYEINDLQFAYLKAPRIGSYYYNSLAPRVYECIARITDKFISPISNKLIVEIRQIIWLHKPHKDPEISVSYVEVERFRSDNYQPATEEQIQRFEKAELVELKKKNRWKKLG